MWITLSLITTAVKGIRNHTSYIVFRICDDAGAFVGNVVYYTSAVV